MRMNAKFLKTSNQADTYYQPSYRKFLKDNKETINEWLRIRIRGNKKILNYKKWYDNMYCDEYEVALDYVEKLGYFIEIEVKNYNETAVNEYDKLIKVAKDLNLNLNNIDKRGYPYHIIYGE